MLIHIVKNNEKIENILQMYHISIGELKENNYHITDFRYIPAGTKLKIPFLNEETEQILDETEAFVNSYYPTLEKLGIKEDSVADIEVIDENKNSVTNNSSISESVNSSSQESKVEQNSSSSEDKVDNNAFESRKVSIQNPNIVYVNRNYINQPYSYNLFRNNQKRALYPGALPPIKPYGGNKIK